MSILFTWIYHYNNIPRDKYKILHMMMDIYLLWLLYSGSLYDYLYPWNYYETVYQKIYCILGHLILVKMIGYVGYCLVKYPAFVVTYFGIRNLLNT